MNEEQAGRLERALRYITDHPREWAQQWYLLRTPCGTLACLAGRVVLDSGLSPVDWKRVDWTGPRSIEWSGVDWAFRVATAEVGSVPEFVKRAAADLLGLDDVQAVMLFDQDKTLRNLWRTARRLSDDRIVVPDPLPEWADVAASDVGALGSPVSPIARYLDEVERAAR